MFRQLDWQPGETLIFPEIGQLVERIKQDDQGLFYAGLGNQFSELGSHLAEVVRWPIVGPVAPRDLPAQAVEQGKLVRSLWRRSDEAIDDFGLRVINLRLLDCPAHHCRFAHSRFTMYHQRLSGRLL